LCENLFPLSLSLSLSLPLFHCHYLKAIDFSRI
jgi:hypothetical protein